MGYYLKLKLRSNRKSVNVENLSNGVEFLIKLRDNSYPWIRKQDPSCVILYDYDADLDQKENYPILDLKDFENIMKHEIFNLISELGKPYSEKSLNEKFCTIYNLVNYLLRDLNSIIEFLKKHNITEDIIILA